MPSPSNWCPRFEKEHMPPGILISGPWALVQRSSLDVAHAAARQSPQQKEDIFHRERGRFLRQVEELTWMLRWNGGKGVFFQVGTVNWIYLRCVFFSKYTFCLISKGYILHPSEMGDAVMVVASRRLFQKKRERWVGHMLIWQRETKGSIYTPGVIESPILGGIKQCTCMVVLRDFPYGLLFGLVIQWPLHLHTNMGAYLVPHFYVYTSCQFTGKQWLPQLKNGDNMAKHNHKHVYDHKRWPTTVYSKHHESGAWPFWKGVHLSFRVPCSSKASMVQNAPLPMKDGVITSYK